MNSYDPACSPFLDHQSQFQWSVAFQQDPRHFAPAYPPGPFQYGPPCPSTPCPSTPCPSWMAPGTWLHHGLRPSTPNWQGNHHQNNITTWNNGWNSSPKPKKKRFNKPVHVFASCDACDRSFKNQEKYNEHLAQHKKCTEIGCNFEAHEKILRLHWYNAHAPGAKRIKLDTPEEILKWKEERRKNYPTAANRAKKLQLEKEKQERGEVLQTAQFGKMWGRGWRGRRCWRGRGLRSRGWRGRGGSNNHVRFQGSHGWDCNKEPTPSDRSAVMGKSTREETQSPSEMALKPAMDPLSILAVGETTDLDSEADGSSCVETPKAIVPRFVTASLGSLMTNYGSSSDSDDDSPPPELSSKIPASVALKQNSNEIVTSSVKNSSLSRNDKNNGLAIKDQDCGWNWGQSGERKVTCPNRAKALCKRRAQGGARLGPKQRPTLLEMLLAQDIRRERNILLQCIRYIIRNDFFGIGFSDESPNGHITKHQ
uniref:Nuclear FMR1 interacting protein 1 n=1 Tax=Eptatretus burgeri TaxID=7764 RepID=A0A8C4QQX4_EPTBU